jgi:hypothetical protein
VRFRRFCITIDDVELHIVTALRLFQEALDPDFRHGSIRNSQKKP